MAAPNNDRYAAEVEAAWAEREAESAAAYEAAFKACSGEDLGWAR